MDFGILRVSTPDGQVREYPLDVASVFIGRAEANRVVVDHVSVSRRHARLEFVDGQARLEDLSSATGTYVAGQRLAPGTIRVLGPGEAVRFGDCQAVLMAAAGVVAGDGAGTGVGAGAGLQGGPGRPEQAINISVTAPGAPVAPGSAATATVVVHNRGSVVDSVHISIQGLPDSWVRITRPAVQLLPDARDEVVVIIQPPRETASLAGQHEFAAAATSSQHNVEVRALGRLVVLPFGDLSLEVRPAQSRRAFTADVANQSNSPALIELRASDPEEALAVTFQPDRLELAPGARADVQVEARLRNAGFFGKESHHPFTTQAVADTRGAMANAELRYRPPWLIVRWFVLALALIAIGAGGWFAYSAFASGDESTPGPDVDDTPTETATGAPGSPTTPAGDPATPTTPPPDDGRMAPGTTAVVTNSAAPNDCLFVRPEPNRQTPVTASTPRICDGTRVTILEGPVQAEDYVWYRIRVQDTGAEGWSAEGLVSGGGRFLTPAQ